MKNEFNHLVELMQKWDLYQSDDEVGMALENLRKKIDEAEKRMECARRTAKEINKAISKYTDNVDKGELFIMKVVDHDSVYNCSNDIGYALDFDETMPIIDNWYGLFTEEIANTLIMESIAEKEMESIIEEDVKLKRGEPIPTYQCKDKETFDKVKQVIHLLKTLDNGSSVDGETMEYILEQVGMQEQMLRQLARRDVKETMAILEE